MKYAQIRKGKVVIIKNLEKKPPVGTWVEIGEEQTINIGDLFIDNTFVSAPTRVFLHIDTDRSPSNVINDGIDILTITATLRDSLKTTSAIFSAFPNKDWYVPIRDSQGSIYSIKTFSFINGVGALNFTTKSRPEICSISQQDFIPVTINNVIYNINLVKEFKFLVREK